MGNKKSIRWVLFLKPLKVLKKVAGSGKIVNSILVVISKEKIMSYRKWIILTSIILACLLGGCGTEKAITEESAEKQVVIEDISMDDNDTFEVTEEEESAREIRKQYVELKEVSDFSEGIAWVKYEDEYGNDHIGWLDTSGKITEPEVLSNVKTFGGKFSSGYDYANYDKNNDNYSDVFLILNQEGDVVASSPDGDGYEIVAAGDGLFLVRQRVRTFDTNQDLYGVVDTAGNWVCDLKADDPFPSSTPDGYSEVTFYYLGEGVFGVRYLRNESWYLYYMFNSETGIVTEYKDSTPLKFYGGKTVLIAEDTLSNELSFITKDGETIFTFDSKYGEMTFGPIYSEELMFSGNYTYDADSGMEIVKNGKFYHTDGSVAVDLSQYTLVGAGTEDLYCFKDGLAPIVLLGADYSPYVTFIDENGEMIFDPIKVDRGYAKQGDIFGKYSNGVIPVLKENENGVTKITLIDIEENIKELSGDIYECKNLEFHDGYSVITEQYTNSSGFGEKRYCVVGIDGNILETYVED